MIVILSTEWSQFKSNTCNNLSDEMILVITPLLSNTYTIIIMLYANDKHNKWKCSTVMSKILIKYLKW
jgi:hypothetical protein